MHVFYFYLQGRQSEINIVEHISDDLEPEPAGLLNKSGFIWLDLGAHDEL